MKTMYLFRSNLRQFEDYHNYKTLDEFRKKCWDFYLLMCLEFLDIGYIDKVIIWRLSPKKKKYDLKTWRIPNTERIFIQASVPRFEDIFDVVDNDFPYISLLRGGFPEYDKLVNSHHDKLGKTLYLGAGQRTFPKYGGKYDINLVEEPIKGDVVPFFKTANPEIFKPLELEKKYDICFPSNFSQSFFKGQKQFIQHISKSPLLKSLKIVHVGNKPEIGKKLCRVLGVSNIEFRGHTTREGVNEAINQSKFGLCYSNRADGTPRVMTEILSTGTPLLISNKTRRLNYYKAGVSMFHDLNFPKVVEESILKYDELKQEAMDSLPNLSMENICKKNWELWTKK